MFITSFGEQNITYKCCSNFLIHLSRSGYKPTGKKANEAKHKRIKELLVAGSMTKNEIAKAVGCGIATVYRVAKAI